MFEVSSREMKDRQDVNIGTEVVLAGEIKYGVSTDQIVSLKQVLERLEYLAKSDVIAINVSALTFWDSLGVNSILGPIVKKINKELASRGKQPVSVIGPKESDLFYAARDKFPESGGRACRGTTHLQNF